MLYKDLPTAFVDLETTGGSARHHRITEIAIVEAGADGEHAEWSTLINPGRSIPAHIGALTGITDAMVADAPCFEDIWRELLERLDGRLFVAHNVQFDYGFLRRAFEQFGTAFRPKIACTVALSRALYPDHRRHDLSTLIERHGLQCAQRHRALDDARALLQWCNTALGEKGAATVRAAVARQLEAPRMPPGVDPSMLDSLPAGPGVYMFSDDNDDVLYVGKSVGVRGRVLSHFSSAARDERERRLFAQIRHIRAIATAGELGALLREAALIKELAPSFNRRLRRHASLFAIELRGEPDDYLHARVIAASDVEEDADARLYGVFRRKSAAVRFLTDLAKDLGLCRKMLGLEKGPGSCFGYQLRQCKGACVSEQSAVAYNNQLLNALGAIRREAWPFDGAVAIRESGRGGSELHVVDRWRYLGTAKRADELAELGNAGAGFDADIYKILSRHLRRNAGSLQIIPLQESL